MKLLEWAALNIKQWGSDSVLVITGHGPDFCHPHRISAKEFVTRKQWEQAKRDLAIKEMLKSVTNYNKTDVIHACEQLYDAGYRKYSAKPGVKLNPVKNCHTGADYDNI